MIQNSTLLKTIIVDDEPLAIQNLKIALEDYPDIGVIEETTSANDAKQLIETLRPDIVFLDINLVSSNAFELLDSIAYRDFHLIFVTAHDEYALKAFEYSASNFILKPLDKSRLDKAIQTIRTSNAHFASDALAKLLSAMKKPEEPDRGDKIALSTPRGVVMRKIEEIVYFKSSGNYCFVYFTDDSKILISKTMKEMEFKFEPHNFYRIHHSLLVNCSKIASYKHGEGEVTLDNRMVFKVSYRRRSNFLKYLRGRKVDV